MGDVKPLCHSGCMTPGLPHSTLHHRLIESLYREAMTLADAARSYFDDAGRSDRDILDPLARVGLSCESLTVTTRLMHVIAWLLTARAVHAGEIDGNEARQPARRLGDAPMTDVAMLAVFPASACRLIEASVDLHRRVARLDAALDFSASAVSPAVSMQTQLRRAL